MPGGGRCTIVSRVLKGVSPRRRHCKIHPCKQDHHSSPCSSRNGPVLQLLAARKDVGGHSGVQQINMAPAKAIKSLEVRLPCRPLCTDAWSDGSRVGAAASCSTDPC